MGIFTKGLLVLLAVFVLFCALEGALFFIKNLPQNYNSYVPKNSNSPEYQMANLKWTKINPTSAYWGGRDAHTVADFNGKMFLYGGIEGGKVAAGKTLYGNMKHMTDIWVTEDGINWQLADNNSKFKERRSINVVTFNNKLYAMGGWENKYGESKHDVWVSNDGLNWQQVPTTNVWPEREGHGTVVFKGKIWVAGGVDFTKRKTYNDVWSSLDGSTWTEVLNKAPWEERYDHTLSVFDNKLWVIGGLNFGDDVLKDVWYSEDGSNWIKVENIPFPARHGHLTLEYKGYMVVIGGWCEGVGGLNDVWFSKDGKTWYKTKKNAPFLGREDLGGIVFKDKIWVMGGMADNGNTWIWQDDIWTAE